MSSPPRIIVTGCNGQLGKELKDLASDNPSFEFIFLSKEDLPIHRPEMVKHYFNVYKPNYLVNGAAYTAVDKAEKKKDKAFRINAEAVGGLAAICKKYDTKLLHISTDYVFDGTSTVPYTENDKPNPLSVYGASKLEGEKQAILANPDTIIIRTSWLYSRHGKNFVKTMLKLMSEKEEIKVVNDQTGSPTYAADLAEAIMQIIKCSKWEPGIYHYCNDGSISWFDFALEIKKQSGKTCKIHPITTSQYPTPARRPPFSVLNTSKIKLVFGIAAKDWKERLTACLHHFT